MVDRIALALLVPLAAGCRAASDEPAPAPEAIAYTCDEGEGDALFHRRIAPLLATDRPKTCNTCHLSGIDLALFVRETPCQTMACLGARGLVDLESPEESTVLQWIARADPESPLISQRVIDEEHAAFRAWIDQTAACGHCFTGDDPCGDAADAADTTAEVCPDEDPREDPQDFVDPGDCEPRTLEALFRHKVYAWRDRCFPCHFEGTKVEAPKWVQTGACELGSLETMHEVFRGGLVDLKAPAQSLILLKPLPEAHGGVMHGGHDKFAGPEDPTYVDFRAWIEREAACAGR